MAQYHGTQAISRAFELLKMFDDAHPEWSLVDLVAASSFKKTTAFRILSALEYEGAIQRTETGNYQLSSELIVLGGRAIRSNSLRAVAQPYLKQLARQTKESTTLDVLQWEDSKRPLLIVIDEVLGQHLLGMTQYIGVRIPAHATAPGKAMLAYHPPDVLKEMLPAQLPAETEHTITSRAAFLKELDAVRQREFAMTMHELELGIMAVGAPIFNQHGDVKASISIGGPSSRITPEQLMEYGRITVKAANKISHQLGYRSQKETP